ncbi:MAG: Gfo/Idh/MocA family oxidoreductase [Pirellulales bacterium]|nr:Gfo/Idh/MocA family oxidoreductase [Pirellulales bacterium]
MKIRLGLVGAGDTWQQRHGPALRALADRFELRAVCEPIGHRACQVADEFHAETVSGFHALARREDVDAVLVLDPGWFGSLPLLAACEAGKAVYCGGGLDLAGDQLETLRQHVKGAGVAFMAEFVRRHAPATLRLRELIATQLGPPRLIFCHRRLGGDYRGPFSNGRAEPARLQKELIELVDWCCYVMQVPPHRVTGMAHGTPGGKGESDYQMLSLDFAPQPGEGPVAQISCGRYIPPRWEEAASYRLLAGMQVVCQEGIAFVDLPSTLVWFNEAGRHQEILDSERPVNEQLLTQFHRAVTSLVQRTSDLDDACQATTIVELAQRSFKEGRRAELPTTKG